MHVRFHSLYAIMCIPKITSQIKYNIIMLYYNLCGSCSGLIVSAHYTPDRFVQVGSLAGFLVSCVPNFAIKATKVDCPRALLCFKFL